MSPSELQATTEVIANLVQALEASAPWREAEIAAGHTLLSYYRSQEQCCPSEATTTELRDEAMRAYFTTLARNIT